MDQIRCQHKDERKHVIIDYLLEDTCRCNFNDGWSLTSSLGIGKHFFEIPKIDEVINRQNMATITYHTSYCGLKMCSYPLRRINLKLHPLGCENGRFKNITMGL